jgi:dTDP-4-amino-4,6-dideoxygalactose transaminase
MSIDLPFHRSWLEDDEINEVVDTLKSGWMTTGPKTQRFEEAFRDYIGCKHAIALNSCTAGLNISLALQNFEPGDEIITTPMTFPATANVIVLNNFKPVFCDIEKGTLNINPNGIEEKVTSRTRAIMPVHYAGHPCEMDSIEAIATKKGLTIFEDAAHALETKYKGRKIGNMGHATSFSFYANKNITTGEGGMITVNDDALAEKIRVFRLHGLSRDAWKRYGNNGYAHWKLEMPGFKYNMADINAALGIHQIKKADRFLKIRKEYAQKYDEAFKNIDEIETLEVKDYAESAHHIYVIALRLNKLNISRDEFLNALQSSGIGVAVHFIALHLQPYYAKTFNLKPEDFPVATDYSNRILTLPLYPKMTQNELDRVINTVVEIINKHKKAN